MLPNSFVPVRQIPVLLIKMKGATTTISCFVVAVVFLTTLRLG
jgi:hypothetical protein